jgi:hypothetical protein
MNTENNYKLVFSSNSDLFKYRNEIDRLNLDIDAMALFYENFEQRDSLPTLEIIIIDKNRSRFYMRKSRIDRVLKPKVSNKIIYTFQYPDEDETYQ